MTKQELINLILQYAPSGGRLYDIYSNDFKTSLNGFTAGSGWAYSGGVLTSPTSGGGWSNVSKWDKYMTIDKAIVRAYIKVINATSVFGLVRQPPSAIGLAGTAALVNGIDNKIRLYGLWDGATGPSNIISEVAIPFTITANRTYLLELIKEGRYHIFKFTDTVTGLSVSINHDNDLAANLSGSMWGAPGVLYYSGQISIQKFAFSTPYEPKPYLMISGDSLTEGSALATVGYRQSKWCELVANEIGNYNVVIAGRGGENAATLLTRKDIDNFTPKYHILMVGTNDSDYTTWLTNYQAMIAKIVATGAKIILCTMPPRSDRQTFLNQANAWIKASGYPYINMAAAVTSNNDEVTWNSACVLADNIHANAEGNYQWYKRVKTDAPYLFDAAREAIPTHVVKTATQQMQPGVEYIAYNTSLVTFTLPDAKTGDKCYVRGLGSGGWAISNPGVIIHNGASDIAAGAGLSSASQYDYAVLQKMPDGSWLRIGQLAATGGGGGTGDVDASIIDGSPNAVSGNAVHDALALKANKLVTLNTQAVTSYTLQASDAGALVRISSASAATVTISSSVAWNVGDQIKVQSINTGQVTLVGSGVAFQSIDGRTKLRTQNSTALITHLGGNNFLLEGDLVL